MTSIKDFIIIRCKIKVLTAAAHVERHNRNHPTDLFLVRLLLRILDEHLLNASNVPQASSSIQGQVSWGRWPTL